MTARSRIDEWFKKLEQPGEKMNREDVCFLMVQSRHLIEASPTSERFRVAAFYADWTVHTTLDRSVVCFEALRDIAGVIAANMSPTSPDLTLLISRIIGFPQLRAELTTLFRENGLPLAIFEYYENWKGFVAFLLWHIAGQPIGWPAEPKGRAKVLRDEMLVATGVHAFAIEALAIVLHETKYHWLLKMSSPDKAFSMLGAFSSVEGPEAFRTPPGPTHA